MSDYEIKATVLGVHPEHGELISASAAKEVIAHFQSQLAKANERVKELEKKNNEYAIDKMIEGAFAFADYLDKSNFSAAIAAKEGGFFQLVETFGQQLRKEQDSD